MSTALNNLLFKVSLLDKMSGPAKGMMKTMDTVTNRVQRGFMKMGVGAAGLAGAGFMLDRIIGPAKEMHSALGEVASLDVAQGVLDDLNTASLKFSVKYGESAADFVRSSYDIQSAISGLVGNELSTFTNASAILAKGTKADTSTITNFVGTMYGIFQKNADTMGKAKWVEMLAGQTATAVQMFKTTGTEMSAAFSSVGAEGQSMGIAMNEQIAVLGTLQATMSGSEAGTKYKSFLAGVGKAQGVLGLQFTDAGGKMLPMVDILQKIQGKFGDIDTVAESDLLQKAFGRKEAVGLIKALSLNVDGLSDSINKVGEQTGMQKAIDMANTMTDPWDRASSGVDALTIMLGQRMLPLLTPVFNGISAVSETLMRWGAMFPNISKYIGIAALGIVGLIAGFSALSIAVGIGSFLMAGWGLAVAIVTSPITGMVVAIAAIGYAIYRLLDAWAQWSYGMSIFDTMKAGYQAAVLGVTNFIETTVNGFLALKNWFNNFKFLDFLMQQVDWLIDKINLIPGVNIDMGGAPKPIAPPPSLQQNQSGNSSKGGLLSQINNANSNKRTDVGGIVIHNYGSAPNGQQLADDFLMAAG